MGRGDLASQLKTLYQGLIVQPGLER
jgi:hypothetical protein